MIIYPTKDRVLVRRDLTPTQRGSIYIPEQWYVPAKDPNARAIGTSFKRERLPPQTGRVLAYGPRTREVDTNDHILFGKYAGTPHPLLDERGCILEILLIMHERDIWAILED